MRDVLFSLSQWFLRPTQDLDVLHRRQEVIRFFTSPRNSDALNTLQSSLRNISNIPVTTLTSDLLFSPHLVTIIKIVTLPKACVCVCLCVLDSSAQDVSLSHQSDRLAESLQGWNYSIAIHTLPMWQVLLNVYKMLHLCVFVRQCTVRCVSGTRCDTCLSPFSSFAISVKGYPMTSTILPPLLIEL